MSRYDHSLSISTFLFGAFPRQLLTAVILEGVGLLGYLQFTSTGLIDLNVTATYLLEAGVVGIISIVLTGIYSYRIGRSSYSPVLHRSHTLFIISIGYTILGIVLTVFVYVIHSLLLRHPLLPTWEEVGFGLSVGATFGFLILLYISRFGVETPGNRDELQAAISEIQEHQRELESSMKAPIQLTKFYESLERSMMKLAKCLRGSSTHGGRKLAQDIEEWTEVFKEKPEVSQAAVIHQSRNPEEQELTELQEDFESITERLEKISKDE
jgi:uncharacterized membrane-anchored protein YhcB (DUF1043 family)